jgi:hypothetical protein
VFDRLPAEGAWQTVLLADGNIGIGSDPRALLGHCIELIAPMGVVLVEVDPDGVEELCTAWFEDIYGRKGPPLPWARLGAPALHRSAEDLALSVTDQWRYSHRCFLALAHQGSPSSHPNQVGRHAAARRHDVRRPDTEWTAAPRRTTQSGQPSAAGTCDPPIVLIG